MRHDLPCSPCFRTTCPYADHPCMRAIEVEDVYRAVLDMLGMGR
jgi:heptosyltransferase-2